MQKLTSRDTVWMHYIMSGWSLISGGCGRGIHNVSILFIRLHGHEESERKERDKERERTRETDFATRARQRRVLSATKLKRSTVF